MVEIKITALEVKALDKFLECENPVFFTLAGPDGVEVKEKKEFLSHFNIKDGQ